MPTRRNSELLMILFAVGLVATFAAGAHGALLGEIGMPAMVMPILFLVLMIVAHFAVRFFAPYADPAILPCVTLLNGLGMVFIARLDLGDADPKERPDLATFGDFGFRQLLWTLVAVIAFVLVMVLIRDHRSLSRYAYTLALVGIILVLLPPILPASISDPGNTGAKLWLRIPGLGAIQPSEFAKLL
ncbi:MAG: FtsW/RodA/SpoVE family cell cycle protein, partial [Micromonosporaceae bacterium]